jgi:hypothetical protein
MILFSLMKIKSKQLEENLELQIFYEFIENNINMKFF